MIQDRTDDIGFRELSVKGCKIDYQQCEETLLSEDFMLESMAALLYMASTTSEEFAR